MQSSGAHLLSKNAQEVSSFQVMQILEQAQALERQGADVIHMEVGEPDFPTPEHVISAAHTSLSEGHTKYTGATGLVELKLALSRYYKTRHLVDVDPHRIIITTGASAGIQLSLDSLIDAGDGVVMAEPGYPCNQHFVRLLDGIPQLIPTIQDNNFIITKQQLAKYWTEDSKVLLLASPSNPTGSVLTPQQLQYSIEFAKNHAGIAIIDEIYGELVFDRSPNTALSYSDDVIVINSFSKYFCMTGWRIGWMVVPEWMVDTVDRLAQNLYLAPPTLAQYAALAAFSSSNLQQLENNRQILKKRRDLLWNGLKQLGFGVGKTPPDGAFYIYASVEGLGFTAESFCHQLLSQAYIAITPGSDFSSQGTKYYVRFAFTQNEQRIKQALERIENMLVKQI